MKNILTSAFSMIAIIALLCVISSCNSNESSTQSQNSVEPVQSTSNQTSLTTNQTNETSKSDTTSDNQTTQPTETTKITTEELAEITTIPPQTTQITTTTTQSQPTETTVKPTPTPVVTTTAQTTAKPTETTTPPNDKIDSLTKKQYDSYGIDAQKRLDYYDKLTAKTDIPIVHISTKNKANITSLETYVDCLVDVFNCDDEELMSAISAGIRVRGNSSAYYGDVSQILKNEVPYRIKFEKKQNMLGLNNGAKCKSWVLLRSNWNLVTDFTALRLGNAMMKDDYFCSDCTFVHVYVNQTFKGIYVLCEQTEVNKNRIDLTEPDKNYTGTDIGYLLEIDNYADSSGKPYFNVNYNNATLTDLEGLKRKLESADYTIKSDITSTKQSAFIKKYINNVFKIMQEAISNKNYLTFDSNYNLVSAKNKYKSAYETINAVCDINSMVDMYILYEIVHDYDCGEGSFNMCVDFSKNSKFKKLTFIAPWDFNWAYNDAPTNKYYAGAFTAQDFVNQYGDRSNPWFILLMNADWFVQKVQTKWQSCYNTGTFTAVINDVKSTLNTYEKDLNKRDDYAVENGLELVKWVQKRVKWLNSVWG